MPYVQVTWVAGRTPEQKRKLAERITLALIEDGRAKRENIQVTFVDLPPTDYAEAGVTVAQQKPPPNSLLFCAGTFPASLSLVFLLRLKEGFPRGGNPPLRPDAAG